MKLWPTAFILSGTYYAPSSKSSGCDLAFVVTGVAESLFPANNSYAVVKLKWLSYDTACTRGWVELAKQYAVSATCPRGRFHVRITLVFITAEIIYLIVRVLEVSSDFIQAIQRDIHFTVHPRGRAVLCMNHLKVGNFKSRDCLHEVIYKFMWMECPTYSAKYLNNSTGEW